MITICALLAHSSCIFMNSWVQPAVAKPANPGHAKNLTRTQLRRLQRRHTQQSYVLMRNKLINMVRPLPPTALIAEHLEAFRATLYTGVSEEKALQGPLDDTAPVLTACNWCGTWMPMPRQANIAIIDKIDTCEAWKATAAETLEEIFAVIPPALKEAGKENRYGEPSDLIKDGMPEINNMLDFQGLLHAPTLCEVVSLMWGEPAQEKRLRAQRVSALRARWSGRSFNALPWLPSLHVSDMGQYSTDPNTGECKTQ